MKQAIVVRNDLDLSIGKVVAQACHASVLAYWPADGVDGFEQKIVLEADIDTLKELVEQCREQEIRHQLVQDAGRTEVESGTVTALAVGRSEESKVDSLTGDLPLLGKNTDKKI